MTESARASVVLFGYGLAGRVFHGPLITAADGLSLDAIVTGNPERAAEAQAAYPDAIIYSTPEQAWHGGHQLAVVATPNVTHVPLTEGSLRAGMHVVLDKPVAATAAAAQELLALANDVDRQVIPFQNRRWDADFRTVCEVVAEGSIGRVHRLDSQIVKMRVQAKDAWRNWADPAEMGGQLYDLGSHAVDQALMLLGPVVRVFALARSVRDSRAADDDTSIVLEHQSGAISRLTVSQVSPFSTPRFEVSGMRGGVRIDAYDAQEDTLASGTFPRVGQEGIDHWGTQPGDAIVRVYDDESSVTQTTRPLARGLWPYYYDAVARCVLEGAPAPVLMEDAVADLRVLDAARESAATGQAVRLDPPAGHRAPAIA